MRQFEMVPGGRRWRIDAAHPARRPTIELDGGRTHGLARSSHDRTRQNARALAAWTVLRVTGTTWLSDRARTMLRSLARWQRKATG